MLPCIPDGSTREVPLRRYTVDKQVVVEPVKTWSYTESNNVLTFTDASAEDMPWTAQFRLATPGENIATACLKLPVTSSPS